LRTRFQSAIKPRRLSTLEAVITWMTIVLVSIPWLSHILFLSFLRKEWNRRVPLVNAWAQFVLRKILKINLHVSDTHSYGSPPYVFVLLNQCSLLESLLIVPAVLPDQLEVFIFANLEFLMVPLLGWVFWKTLGSEMVIRQNHRQARRAINRAIKRMTEDKASMIISIEGKRSTDGTLSPYKRGPALIAIQTGATIVPVIIRGTREVWPYGDWKLKVGGDITVQFLPGIETKDMTLEDRFELTQQLRNLAEKELNFVSQHKSDDIT